MIFSTWGKGVGFGCVLVCMVLLHAQPAMAYTCLVPAAVVDSGVMFDRNPVVGVRVTYAWGIQAELEATQCFRIPVFVGLGLWSDTRGPPTGAGVDAVRVSSARIDLGVILGTMLGFRIDRNRWLGGMIAVGPDLRITRVSTTINNQKEVVHGLAVLARVMAGPVLRVNAWDVRLLVSTAIPADRGAGIRFAFAYHFEN